MMKAFRRAAKEALLKASGVRVYRSLPFGVDIFHDLQRRIPWFDVTAIVDVGANIGQSADRFLANYPNASILCIEPGQRAYHELTHRMARHPQATCMNIALAEQAGDGTLAIPRDNTMSRLSALSHRDTRTREAPNVATEQVTVTTLDQLADELSLTAISYLKIDTEGADLLVLKGAERLLKEESIDAIQVEVGMHNKNSWHVPIAAATQYLNMFNYKTFGIYDQVAEWQMRKPYLRRVNCVLISERLSDQSTQ